MYSRILVPLDGSEFSETALPYALALAEKSGATLHLVSVLDVPPPNTDDQWLLATRDWLRAYLANVADQARRHASVDVTTALRSGIDVDALLAEAEEVHADLIVMATHGRGAVARAWLGSVARALTRAARVPLILIRPSDTPASGDEPTSGPRKILVPLDGSELSERALEHATELGALFGSAYHLTRIVATPIDIASPYLPHTVQMNQAILADAKADALDYLEGWARDMRRRGLHVTTSVAVGGQAGHGILSEAQAAGCDFIVMATHGRTGVGRLVLGSAADAVSRGTHLPVMLHRPANVPAPA